MAAKKKSSSKRAAAPEQVTSRRTFPHHSLEESLTLAQKIADEMGGRPMNRLLLADAVGIKPSSSNYRLLLSSAFKYGLIDGTEKSAEIGLTDLGTDATQKDDAVKRTEAIRQAVLKPQPEQTFLQDYKNKKLPSGEMLPKILTAQYGVPRDLAIECGTFMTRNARFAGMLREIGGSPHILFEGAVITPTEHEDEVAEEFDEVSDGLDEASPDGKWLPMPAPPTTPPDTAALQVAPNPSKPIFVGHGKNLVPLQKLEGLLTAFQIPFKVTVKEANLGRPIPQKVKETMLQCGSAILIFTKDEKFFDESGGELWRPSENVVHELGAAAFAYGDRIVVFKEKGLHFPTNFQSIGYIEFEVDSIDAKTADLLKELIGFGLVKVMPT